MSLYSQWKAIAFQHKSQEEALAFWNEYCEVEKSIYERVLEGPVTHIAGTISDLAKEYGVDNVSWVGFVDGVNTSLVTEIDLDQVDEDTNIELDIDLEKLYYNMLDAKADWLYNLPQWNNLLTEEKRKEIRKAYNATRTVVKEIKVGRNEPCPCGSGKKYKKCCGN